MNKAGNPESIAGAMARVVNAVTGKKNNTWFEYFMLAATPVNAPPDEPQVIAGGLRERVRRGAIKNKQIKK